MHPVIPAALAFLNFFLGMTSGKMTQDAFISFTAIYIADVAFGWQVAENIGIRPKKRIDPQEFAIAWGILNSFILWGFAWMKGFFKLGR